MRRTNLFLFFLLPFLGILVIFLSASALNRAYIRTRVEQLAQEQLLATAEILKVNLSHLIDERYPPDKILDLYSREENIYYLALLDGEKNVLGWSSRFEGYLPLSLSGAPPNKSWIIDSPAGKIFNAFVPISSSSGGSFSLYLGYSMTSLEAMLARSNRSFIIVLSVIIIFGIIFFRGVFRLQSQYLQKKKEAEDERLEKERFREISAFTSGVAHEIKNPLNSLSLLFELLHKKVPQDTQEDLVLGKSEVRKISGIIDRFSDFLKPLHLEEEDLLFEELVREVTESIGREFPGSPARIQYAQKQPVRIKGDRALISQALINIIKNALEAAEAAEVFIQAGQTKKKVHIRITDKGKGMPGEVTNRAFDPFFSTKKEGMGIGLYLARKIVEAHEGAISVESRPGEGTTFHLYFSGG